MKTFKNEDIRSWNCCYDPATIISDDWSGTALDFLNIEGFPVQDRIWATMRQELLALCDIRLFSVWCANQLTQTDARSITALEVATKLANEECSEEDRLSAQYAAWQAVAEAPNDYALAASKAAAHALMCEVSSSALGASYWAAQVDPNNALAQIAQAISIFNDKGL